MNFITDLIKKIKLWEITKNFWLRQLGFIVNQEMKCQRMKWEPMPEIHNKTNFFVADWAVFRCLYTNRIDWKRKLFFKKKSYKTSFVTDALGYIKWFWFKPNKLILYSEAQKTKDSDRIFSVLNGLKNIHWKVWTNFPWSSSM